MKRVILYNPKSNEGRAKEIWKDFVRDFPAFKQHAYDVTKIKHLGSFLRENAPELVVIAGGDGTINSVGTAVLQLRKQPKLAILPLGFGNALSYSFGVETLQKALEVIEHPEKFVSIDVMKTNLKNVPIGLFNIGTGFDARIVHDFNTRKYIGIRSYIFSGFQSIMFHPDSEITFTIDHTVKLSALASSLMVANGPTIGYNYLVAPEAKLNDGKLDCTLFSTKVAYLTNLRLRGFKHPLYSKMNKVHFQAKHIKIEGEPFVQIDGEPVDQPNGLEISMHPKKLTFFYHPDILQEKEAAPFLV
ncbi:MAG TPA: diacylglycerol kinase family protein [Patescibacteria group bacterium]|nr:diacylglycerol kinase family protein [Patescibacteria group bacterium]